MATRSLPNRASVFSLFILSGVVVLGCSNTWAFRLREQPDAHGDKPHTLALRCKEQPVRFAVREAGLVRSFGPVVLTCDPSTPATHCKTPAEGTPAPREVGAGAWLMIAADDTQFSKDASTANGALCWVKEKDSSECADESHLLDVYIECPKS